MRLLNNAPLTYLRVAGCIFAVVNKYGMCGSVGKTPFSKNVLSIVTRKMREPSIDILKVQIEIEIEIRILEAWES